MKATILTNNIRSSNAPLLLALLLFCAGVCRAQSPSGTAAQRAPSEATGYAIAQVGPHSRVWQNPTGQSVTEIATGMNYWDGQQWTPSDPFFVVSPDGTSFVAAKIQDPTRLAGNLNCAGAVTVTTPDNVTLRSTPIAIGLYDAASGKSVIVATLTNTTGVLVDRRHVVYDKAFVGGGFSASVVYSLPDTGSFHQDVVFTGFDQPFDPTVWGFDAASTNTLRIQIFTEFYDCPQPQMLMRPLYIELSQTVRASMATPDLIDYYLDFGDYVFGPGRAYASTTNSGARFGATVAKDFVTSEGRTFLVESIPYQRVVGALQRLPAVQVVSRSISHPVGAKATKLAAVSLPQLRAIKQGRVGKTISAHAAALAADKSPAVVVDYVVTVSSSTTPVLYSSDTTYFVSGTVYDSAAVTMESAVFKYPIYSTGGGGSGSGGSGIVIQNSLTLDVAPTLTTTNYRPAIFTAADDNTAGATLSTNIWSGYTGSPGTNYYGNVALAIAASPAALHNLRFCYMTCAIELVADYSGQYFSLSHSELVDCITGVSVNGGGSAASGGSGAYMTLNAYNCLMANVQYPFEVDNVNLTGNACNCTIDSCSNLIVSQGGGIGTFSFTNSIMSNVVADVSGSGITLVGGYNAFSSDSAAFGSPQFPSDEWQAAGAGKYYLATNSSLLTNGTTDIDPALLAQLQAKTTQAPLVVTGYYTTNITLGPVVKRDTNGTALGFHYDPIDYIAIWTVTNATLTLTNGIVLAYYNTPGICLLSNAKLVSQGSPNERNYLAYYGSVQEQPTNLWDVTNTLAQSLPIAPGTSDPSTNVSIYLRLTSICAPTGESNLISTGDSGMVISDLTLQDCEVYGSGAIWQMTESNNTPVVGLTNNVFYRVPFAITNSATISSFNNLFYGTTNTNEFSVTILHGSGTSSNIHENDAFDGVMATLDGTVGYNAYLNGATNTAYTANHDVWTNMTWIAGALGDYYQATNSPLLTNGSTFATNLGLYHYTVMTNNKVEGTNIVSRGYHYVALGTNGLPLISNPYGVPDYLVDANGDGIVDNGEIPWDWGITSQPQSTNVVQGQNATFSVTASGVSGIGAFSYQWLSNGTSIADANGSNYTILVVQTNDAANYSVVVSNGGAGYSSSIAALMVTTPLAITNEPAPQTVLQGANASFTVGVSGNYLAYRWYSNGVALNNGSGITGATTSALTLSDVVTSDAANYSVVVTNLFGSVTSAPASLTVIAAPIISSSPTNTTAIQANDATFSVTATSSDLAYQWWFTNSTQTNSIADATNSSYTQLVVETNDAGYYTVIITNLAGSTNASAELTVLVPPWITNQPANVITNEGSNATFSVGAFGTTNLTYQWYMNGTNAISGATNPSLTFTGVQASNAAGYDVVVSNIAGTNTSAWAWMSVVATGGGSTNNGWGSGANTNTNGPIVTMIGPTNTFPTSPAVYLYGSPISIHASATSPYSYITNVEFYYTGTNNGSNSGTDFMLAGTAVPGSNAMFALAWTNSLPGTNVLKARAWDCNGTSNDSPVVYVIMAVPPTISAGPSTNLVWTEGSSGTNIELAGSVSSDGVPNIGETNIQWSVVSGNGAYATFSSSTSLTSTVSFATNGIFTLQLQADNHYATNTSNCTVTIERRPKLYFNAPTNNEAFLIGTPVVLDVTATSFNPVGIITNVQFYYGVGLTNIGAGIQSLSNTYTFAWYDAPLWTNAVYAIATDNYGLTSTSSVSIAMLPPLAVYFISPTSGQLFAFSPTNILLTALPVSYIGSTVTSVSFSNQFTNFGAGIALPSTNGLTNYQVVWQDVTNSTNYTLSVKAIDNKGNAATNSVTIIVNAMPTISITTPTNLQSFPQGSNVTITATASDSDGTVTNVQFFEFWPAPSNSLSNFPASNSTVTNSVTWTNLAPGNYPVVAVATDNLGAQTMSAITVFIVAPTNPPPFVEITYPTNGSVFVPDCDITITAIAYPTNSTYTTNFGGAVTNVAFFKNGISIGNVANPPYAVSECCWKPGTYQLTALAIDSHGTSSETNVWITIAADVPISQGFWDATFCPTNSGDSTDPYAPLAGDACGNFLVPVVFPSSTVYNSRYYVAGTSFTTPGMFGAGSPDVKSTSLYEWDGNNWMRWGGPYARCGSFPLGNEDEQAAVVGGVAINDSGLYAIGNYSNSLDDVTFIVEQTADGTNWQALGGLFTIDGYLSTNASYDFGDYDRAYDIRVPKLEFIGEDLYMYGDFDYTNNASATNIEFLAMWSTNTTNWWPVGTSLNGPVFALASFQGNLVIGGLFTNAGGNPAANHIAELTNGSWTNLGSGVGGEDYTSSTLGDYWTNVDVGVFSLAACDPNLFVGGDFTSAGDKTNANGIAVWNGAAWSTIGSGLVAVNASLWEDGYPLPFNRYVSESSISNPIVYTISPHGNTVYVAGIFTDAMNKNGSDVPAASIAAATWDERTQQWTWSDLEGGIYSTAQDNVNGTNASVAQVLLTTAIVNGTNSGCYDLMVAGEFELIAGLSGNDELHLFNGVSRWRMGYPKPASLPTVTITSPTSPCIVTNSGSLTINLVGLATSGYTNIQSVNLYTNGLELDSLEPDSPTNSFAFTNAWSVPSHGLYLITASTTDASNLVGVSAPLIVNVKNPSNSIIAVDDQYTLPVGTLSTDLQVLANDSPSTDLKISQLTILHSSLGTVSISFNRNYLIFTPFPNVYGTDIFFYTVTNSAGSNDSALVTVNILGPPQVSITNPVDGETTNTGSSLVISGTSSAIGPGNAITNINLLIYSNNGIASVNQTITNSGAFGLTWTNPSAGWYTFIAIASDTNGSTNASAPVTITFTNSTAGSTVTASITNLNATYTSEVDFTAQIDPLITNGIFDLRGMARDSVATNPVSYQVLLYQPSFGIAGYTSNLSEQAELYEDSPLFLNITPGPTNYLGFHIGGDSNGDLGLINLTSVPNGKYEIVLQVRGGTDVTNTLVEIQINSQLKIGQFSFSEQDLILPVSGIPLTITRTYNSMNPVNTDFGFNWTFAISSMNIQLDDERETLTLGGNLAPNGPDVSSGNNLPPGISVRVGGGWDVTLTLPNGQTAMFECMFTGDDLGDYYPSWKTPPGIHYTLTDINGYDSDEYYGLTACWNNTGGLENDGLAFDNFDIPGWVLTDNTSGVQYYITRGSKTLLNVDANGSNVLAQVYGPPMLTKIIQPTGDTISIAANGISHYPPPRGNTNASRSVSFVRDSAGRIIAVYDPNSTNTGFPAVKYVYDQSTSNLIQVLKLLDGGAGTYTTNFYDYNNPQFPHYITSMENGDGVTVTRNYYDSTGRLIEVEDANGNFTQFIHNLTNNTEVVIDPQSNTTTYLYDGMGNVLAQTNALGQATTMAYDGNNNKTNQITYLAGLPYATNSYVYDQTLNLPLLSTDPLGHTNAFSYDTSGDLLTSTDARGNTTINRYDVNANLTNMSDALSNSTSYTYANGMLSGSIDPLGTITTNYYDSSQNLVATATLAASSGAILSTNSFTYDLNGNRLTSTVWRHSGGSWGGATTTSVYDAQNRVTQTIDPDGGTNSVVYDPTGKQLSTTDTLGHTTLYAYDYMGRLVETTYPDSSSETSAYDANGNCTNSVDRLGRVTTYAYDALNRLTTTIYPGGATSTTVYDGIGRVAETIDALGTVTGFAYDVAGRQLAVTNAVDTGVAATNFYAYDNNGNQTNFTDALGHATAYVFDALNRRIEVLFPDGTTTLMGYDGDGRRVAQTNQDGIVTSFGYDGAGRLTSVTNALSQITSYQYDETGNQTNQSDALNRTNSYIYDSMGRQTLHIMPGGQSNSMVYDTGGNLLIQTNFNGAVITNDYDVMNRLTNQASVNGYEVSFTYTATGQRSTMMDSSGTYTYLYDNRDRLTNKTVLFNGGTNMMLNYAYDSNGNLTALWSSLTNGPMNGYHGVSNAYGYDALNRLTNVQAGGVTVASNGFDGVGNLQSEGFGNGVTNLYRYDKLNRLTNAIWKLSGTSLAIFSYQLGLTGVRTGLTESITSGSSSTYQWQYDGAYRLTNEYISTLASNGYGLDAVGNRTNRSGTNPQTFAYNTNDWLTTDVYDANGNTIWSTNGIAMTGSNYYDVENRLTNFNNGAAFYTYDGDGIRVSKTVGSSTTYYLMDDRNPTGYPQVLEEWSGTNLARLYNYGLRLISQSNVAGGSVYYYGMDGHGSVRFLTGTNGAIANTYAYDAYGNLTASNVTVANEYLYCGEQYDADVGMYYLRARYYQPATGRFWTMDTYEGDQNDPLSLHKYLYVADNPVNGVDPSGHDGDFGSLMMSVSIGASLDGMYNGGVTATGNAMIATLRGVQANQNAQQILTGYLVDVAVGVAMGVVVSKVAQFGDELIFGGGAAANACFVSGTPVATESGEKPIEQIKAGDVVWSWDELTGEFQLEKVVSTHVRQVDSEVIVRTADETVTATLTHPFRVENKGWVYAGALQPGDQFISLNGNTETVTETTTTNAAALVYNFEVENTHTYFVGEQPVLVHNACAWAKRSASLPDEPGIYVIRTSTGERYVGQAKNLSSRLSSSSHAQVKLIRDPNNEVFTMSLDASKVKGSMDDALHAAEDFYIKALGAKRTASNPMGINARIQRNSDWMNSYFQQNGFPPMSDPVAH